MTDSKAGTATRHPTGLAARLRRQAVARDPVRGRSARQGAPGDDGRGETRR